jgi:hypothetical protein
MGEKTRGTRKADGKRMRKRARENAACRFVRAGKARVFPICKKIVIDTRDAMPKMKGDPAKSCYPVV